MNALRIGFAGMVALLLQACGGGGSGGDAPRVAFRAPVVGAIVGANPVFTRQLLFIDADNDGRRDFVVSFQTGDGARYGFVTYLGNGDGSFRQGPVLEPGFIGATGDFDGDGRTDFASCQQGNVRLYRGTTSGLAGPTLQATSPTSCEEIATGDFNDDGRVDLVLVVRGPGDGLNQFFVLFGLANGGWQQGPLQVVPGMENAPSGWTRVYPAHFNADRRADLLVTAQMASGPFMPMVLLGNGDGTFTRSWPTSPLPEVFEGRSATHAGVADLDGDGRTDVVLDLPGHFVPLPPPATMPPPRAGSNVALRGMGDGTLGAIAWQGNPGVSATGLVDLDGDGRIDSVSWAVFADRSELRVAFGRGDGVFFDPLVIATDPARRTGQLFFADVNGDGRVDILSASNTQIAVFLRE